MRRRGEHLHRWTGRSMVVVVALLVMASSLTVAIDQVATASSEQPKVIVSLTWDDGRASQAKSLEIQQRHSMPATYYLNSTRVGTSSYYMGREDLDSIVAAGNEVGGHTERHENLTTIPLEQAQQTICNDRATLTSWYGADAGRSFAYPYGANNPDVRRLVADCGYTSGRATTGVLTPYVCSSCRTSESLPAADPTLLATPSSVTSRTTLEDLQFQITQASLNGGGWVIFVLHDIGVPSNALNIDPALYSRFLDWLAARTDVTVMTVGDVMATSWPAHPPTTSPITSPTRTEMNVANAGLENDANSDGVSDCFTRAGFGSNSSVWTRTADARSGLAAEEVSLTQHATGDRKLLVSLDAGSANGGCAPSVDPDHSYEVSVWYRSTVPTRMVVFTRDGAGSWRYWATGPTLQATSGWTQAVFTAGPPPAGTTALSWGLAISSVGSLAVDDFSLTSTELSTPYTDPVVKNASLEVDADRNSRPDCWLPSGFGTSSYSFTRVDDARTGQWGHRLSVTSLSSGDRKMVIALDRGQANGGCAIDVTPGSHHRLGVWYHSNVPVTLFVFLRDTNGVWKWWSSASFAASPTEWTLASRTTAPIPSWATGLSFGLGLTSVGTVVTDDYSAARVG